MEWKYHPAGPKDNCWSSESTRCLLPVPWFMPRSDRLQTSRINMWSQRSLLQQPPVVFSVSLLLICDGCLYVGEPSWRFSSLCSSRGNNYIPQRPKTRWCEHVWPMGLRPTLRKAPCVDLRLGFQQHGLLSPYSSVPDMKTAPRLGSLLCTVGLFVWMLVLVLLNSACLQWTVWGDVAVLHAGNKGVIVMWVNNDAFR